MTIMKETICAMRDEFSFADLERRANETVTLAVDAGVTCSRILKQQEHSN